jgi:hypothetical protein
MRFHLLRMAILAAAVGAAAPAGADVKLVIANGHVTLSATNATVPQILAEWARVGQTRIVNGERVIGAPVTLELADVPEAQALEIILRAASGYVLAPRQIAAAGASAYDRIYVVPTSNAPRAPMVAAAPPIPVVAAPRFAPGPPQIDNDATDDVPRRNGPIQPPPQALPVPPPQFATPAPAVTTYPTIGAAPRGNSGATTPGTFPSASPAGSAVPGMVVPAPAPVPGQIPITTPPQR